MYNYEIFINYKREYVVLLVCSIGSTSHTFESKNEALQFVGILGLSMRHGDYQELIESYLDDTAVMDWARYEDQGVA